VSDEQAVQTVRLTPPGRSAVATLLVTGPGALREIDRCFRPSTGLPLSSLPSSHSENRPVFGYFVAETSGTDVREEVVARRQQDGSVELHCHGGQAAISMIEDALTGTGGRRVDWKSWTRQSQEDPITVAARLALSKSQTERTAAILLDQFQGALRLAMHRIERSLMSHQHDAAREQIETLLTRAHYGIHLTQPWQIVVAGSPNVGKSSLINRLMGYRRAIVHEEAGTTRDLVTSSTTIGGWPVSLIDTAGLRQTAHSIEQEGVALAAKAMAEADLTLWVVDARTPPPKSEKPTPWQDTPTMVVRNKCDLVSRESTADTPSSDDILVSALSGQGIEDLQRAIATHLVPDPPPPGAAVPFRNEELELLEAWLAKIP